MSSTTMAEATMTKNVDGTDKEGSGRKRELVELIITVGGIYGAFLTWAVLQERIATTAYGPDERIFRGSLVINTVQSALAAVVGYIYVVYRRKSVGEGLHPVFADTATLKGYGIVAVAQSLSSYCAYASLQYGVDYLTLLLAKSCKLLPLMALHMTVYRRRYPVYKYVVVAVITVGVCLFSIYHPNTAKKGGNGEGASFLGALLLGANLMLDGFYNSTQDNMFKESKGKITGPHMMCGLNLVAAVLTTGVLCWKPSEGQLGEAIDFISQHPRVLGDIVLFGLCGALGQLFIFHALATYGSIVLVTVTVTRKMFSMLLSVIWFNHTLSQGQWAGVLAVFSGIGAEAYVKHLEKSKKLKTN